MALPTNAMSKLQQKISDTFLKRPRNPILQIASITGTARRSKSAVPGWYKKMSMGSNDVPSETQHAGMSPSSRFVASSRNGSLVKSALKYKDMAPKQNLMSQINSLSRDMKAPIRTQSLPRWTRASVMTDRESDTIYTVDVKPRNCSSSTNLSKNETENLENTSSATEAEQNTSLEEMEEVTLSEAEAPPEEPQAKDPGTTFKRTVNINLNDLDPVISEAKKTLSMDINVIVSVKSPENAIKPEIGFQELPGKQNNARSSKGGTIENTMPIETENLNISDSEEAENLKFGQEQGLFSQKDIIEQIGKVYMFLKNNDGTQSTPTINDQKGLNIVKNYDAVKKLYVNALGCVKACEELKNNNGMRDSDTDTELLNMINELEGCFAAQEDSNNLKCLSHGRQSSRLLGSTTPDTMGMRMYSSSTDCEKAKKLPCLQSSELTGKKASDTADAKSVCEKLCMPCCKPARDPPRCFYPYHKPPCKKLKAPRPAFSECKQMFEMKQIQPCECVKPRATRCKKSEDSQKCDRR